MSMHHLHGRARMDDPVPVGRRSEETGAYLTDGTFLYRVVGSIAGGADQVVEIEDCYALDVVQVPIGELRTRRLRVVTPSNTLDLLTRGSVRTRSSAEFARGLGGS